MKKKLITLLFMLVFMCAVIAGCSTITASAAIHAVVYVGNTEVTEQNASDVLGDGTVSFDYATNTLTLNNATITECFTEEFFGEDTYFGIYCEANEFNLQLVGENTIYLSEGKDDDNYYAVYSSGAMNVGGNGSLSVTSFGGIAAMGNLTVKDCSLDFSGIGVVSMGKVSFENVTIEAFAAVMAYSDVTVKDSTMVAGTTVVALEETGSLLIEDSAITVANGQYGTPIEVTSGNVTIKNSTLNLNVNAVEEESAMGIFAGNQLTLENVQANIEVRTNEGYALMGMAKVTIKQSNLTISTVSLEDSAIGINSSGKITIEESVLEIDVRGGKDLSAGIGTMSGKVEIKDSTLKLTASGNSIVGVLGVNIDLINCNGFVEVMAVGEGELMGAGLGTVDGTLTINGGVLNIEATGPADDAFGILIEGVTPPTFIDTNITIRGSGAASVYAPNLNAYGREYAIEVSEDIDCDTPTEYNAENIHDYKYISIHGFYTVAFDANGGTGTMASEEDCYGLLILPMNLFSPPAGKQFLGWAYSADGEVINGTKVEVLHDITLYAIWVDIPHTHDFAPATCTAPKTCACGATEGEPIAHDFAPATCTTPKTCACGATEGEPLAHDFAPATCTEPKTCACGATEGEPLAHDFAPATCTAPKTCSCGATEGEPIAHAYATEWTANGEEHHKACACGAKRYQGAHIDSNANGSCDICGFVMTQAEEGGLGTGAIVGIAVGGSAVVLVGGFAIVWFGVKKKTLADLRKATFGRFKKNK